MRNNIFLQYKKRIMCIVLMIIVVLSSSCMVACTNQDESGNSNETENSVRAADPMTEEEMEADDTDGCIEDSEDLLY